MDYIMKKDKRGYWKCLLYPNMYFMGELKERLLVLCCIPACFFRQINFWFGERLCKTTGTSRCSAIFGILFIPVILLLAVLAVLVILLVIIILRLNIWLPNALTFMISLSVTNIW